ncbi:Mam33 protein [Saccharomycopsis crataegensis]|uniref:Mam33 protein n=1 Tax=Saccharomycopsis crataegensis TaxID=43959 RepID=A0AAV5QHM5_9ASCO|nr:Mam33 protein [Saccharomycopsis crataegensis]
MAFRSSLRLATKQISRYSLLSQAAKVAFKAPVAINQRYFSYSQVAKGSKENIVNVLKSEIQLETEIDEHKEKPEVINAFLDSTGFKVVESSNKHSSLAEIVKETDSEIIHIYFDVSQVTNIPEPNIMEQEGENNEEFDFEKDLNEEFANVNIVVEKKADNSAISIEVLFKLDDCSMYVESVTPYADSKLALSESAESETVRQITYHGPPFSNLDESLQESIESYIKDLGVDESLGDFVISYSEYKENKEYFTWLNSLQKFFS